MTSKTFHKETFSHSNRRSTAAGRIHHSIELQRILKQSVQKVIHDFFYSKKILFFRAFSIRHPPLLPIVVF